MPYSLYVYMYHCSIFSDMRRGFSYFGIDSMINFICMLITKLLIAILNGAQFLIEGAWTLIQYGTIDPNQSKAKADLTVPESLYKIFRSYLWIPIAIALVILAVRLLMTSRGRDDLKRFSYNLVIMFFVVLFLPTILFNVNTQVLKNNQSAFTNATSENIGNKIFYRHTTDYKYIYDTCFTKIDSYAQGNHSFSDTYSKYKKKIKVLTEKNAFNNYQFFSTNKKNIFEKQGSNQDIVWKTLNLDTLDINEVIDEELVTGTPSTANIDSSDTAENVENTEASIQQTKFFALRTNKVLEEALNSIDFAAVKAKKDKDYQTNKKKISSKLNDAKKTNTSIAETRNEAIRSVLGNDVISGETKIAGLALNSLIGVNIDLEKSIYTADLDNFLGLINSHYFRYRVDFLNVWIELIANIMLFFAASYAIVKLAWELMLVQLFAPIISAMDLSGGDRVKRALTNLIGLYVSIVLVCLSLVLYNGACSWLYEQFGSSLMYSVLVFMLASVTMDAPNIIAKLFGVEIGMRGGASMLKRSVGTAAGMAMMAHRAHKMNKNIAASKVAGSGGMGQAASLASGGVIPSGSPAASGKMSGYTRAMQLRHPIAAIKQAAYTRLGNGINSVMDEFGGTKEKLQDLKNTSMGNGVKYNNSSEYLKAMEKQAQAEGRPFDKNDAQNIETANMHYAKDHKDDILNASVLQQYATGSSSEEAIKDVMEQSYKFNNKHLDNVASNLNYKNAIEEVKQNNLNSIADNAEQLMQNDKRGEFNNPMDAYKTATQQHMQSNGINQPYNSKMYETGVEKMAHAAMANANADSIKQEAAKIKKENPGISTSGAVEIAIRDNKGNVVNGAYTGPTDKQKESFKKQANGDQKKYEDLVNKARDRGNANVSVMVDAVMNSTRNVDRAKQSRGSGAL